MDDNEDDGFGFYNESEYEKFKETFVRYFTVYFSGIKEDNTQQNGKLHLTTEKGKFVNEEYIHELIEKLKLKDPFITHVREYDEDDFNDFIETKSGSRKKQSIDIPKSKTNNNTNNLDEFI